MSTTSTDIELVTSEFLFLLGWNFNLIFEADLTTIYLASFLNSSRFWFVGTEKIWEAIICLSLLNYISGSLTAFSSKNGSPRRPCPAVKAMERWPCRFVCSWPGTFWPATTLHCHGRRIVSRLQKRSLTVAFVVGKESRFSGPPRISVWRVVFQEKLLSIIRSGPDSLPCFVSGYNFFPSLASTSVLFEQFRPQKNSNFIQQLSYYTIILYVLVVKDWKFFELYSFVGNKYGT